MIMTISIIIIVISFTLFLNDMLRNTERTNKWNDDAKMARQGSLEIEKLLSFTTDVAAFSFHVFYYLA